MEAQSEKFLIRLQDIVEHGFENAARGFSGMVCTQISILETRICSIPFQQIPTLLGGAENEAVGIYLRIDGEFTGQVMVLLPLEKAMKMVDLLFEKEIGSTTQLGSLERSALAEVGNLICSCFLNEVYKLTKIFAVPTPPVVMIDMIGSILDVIIATMGELREKVFMFQTRFEICQRETPVNFWIIPDPVSLNKMITLGNENE